MTLEEAEQALQRVQDELEGKTRSLEIERKWHEEARAELAKATKFTQDYTEELQLAVKVNEDLEKQLKTYKEMWESQKLHHKNDRQVIIEHTDASALVKQVYGLDKTDPMDDQLFEIACQRVMSAVKVYNEEKASSYTGKDKLFTVACQLSEARSKLKQALVDMKTLGPGSVLPWLRIALIKTTEAFERCAMADSHNCRHEGYKNGMRDARNGCVCDKQPGKCPTHDILIGKPVEALGTDE